MIPVLVSSGFGLTDIRNRLNGLHIEGVVSKPYNFDHLREVVKTILEEQYKP